MHVVITFLLVFLKIYLFALRLSLMTKLVKFNELVHILFVPKTRNKVSYFFFHRIIKINHYNIFSSPLYSTDAEMDI